MIALAAALSASIAIGAPVTVGQVANPSGTLGPSAQADPAQGGWIQFGGSGGRQLARVSEAGQVTAVSLPPELGGEAQSTTLQLTPLKSGWVVAVNTVFPGGRTERAQCLEETIAPTNCGQLAVAERSPAGDWTPVQRLPRTRGLETRAAEAVESQGRIELAWAKENSGLSQPFTIASARAGRPFGHVRRVARLMRSEPTFQTLNLRAGKLYVLGEFGPHEAHAIERPIHADGSLGAPSFLYSHLLRQQGDRVTQRAGAEAYVYEQFYPLGTSVFLARRAAGAPSYGHPQVISRDGEVGYQLAQNRAGRILIALRRGRRDSQLEVRTISALGLLEPVQTLETGPLEPEGGYAFLDALSDAGNALILSADARGRSWAYASAPRCPRFDRQPLALSGVELVPQLFVGHRGVFHLFWEDAGGVVHTATARAHCVPA